MEAPRLNIVLETTVHTVAATTTATVKCSSLQTVKECIALLNLGKEPENEVFKIGNKRRRMTAEELEQPLEESTFWDEEEVHASFHHIRKGMSESPPRLNGINTFTDFCRFGDLLKTHKVQVGGKDFFHGNTRKFKIVEESTI